MKHSGRTERLAPFYVMELLEQARAMEAAGEDIVHMEIGEPDFPTPGPVKEAALAAIRENRTFYTQSLGLPALRERIARYYRERHDIAVPPDRIIITNGTSGAFLLLSAVLLDKGRTLAVSDPGYPCYRNFAALFDAELLPVPVTGETGFSVTVDALRAMPSRPDVMIIANPSNPTGALYRNDSIGALNAYLEESGGVLIVDEIYLGLTYGTRARTALAVSDRIVVVEGFSKAYAMTGWRLGWMVVPEELVRPVQIVAQNVFISPPSISQHAALAAFNAAEELEGMRKTYQERRDFLLPALKRLGFTIPADPEGAFYIYAGIGRWGIDSAHFADRALKEAKVAITPGHDFGMFRAGDHVRFSYATGIERLRVGCERLERWLQTFTR